MTRKDFDKCLRYTLPYIIEVNHTQKLYGLLNREYNRLGAVEDKPHEFEGLYVEEPVILYTDFTRPDNCKDLKIYNKRLAMEMDKLKDYKNVEC